MNSVHFSAAVCKRIRTQLDHYLSNELSVETNHEVMRHLEACAACAGELDARMRVRGFLRQAIESETAPPALRQRIEGRIRKRESSFSAPRFSPGWALTAAPVAIVVLGRRLTVLWLVYALH